MLLLRWYYNIIVIVIDIIFLAMAMQVYTGAAGMKILNFQCELYINIQISIYV